MPLTTRRVDYDQIAPLYDEPGRDYDPDPDLSRFLKRKSRKAFSALRLLDTGCGTGKQLAADRAAFDGLALVGLDLFHGMLQQARRRCAAVGWIQGDCMRPPFADASFDYITNQFSYHHVPDKVRLISETYRILKPGGRFVITNLDPWSMRDWIVYRYFPTSRECDLADFLPVDKLIAVMQQAGFRRVRVRRELTPSEENLGQFLAYASQRYRTSHLMEIADQDYEDGLAGIRADIQGATGKAVVPSEICLVWITGNRPARG